MHDEKFISLTLSTMLRLQLLPAASFAMAPATDTSNAGLIAEDGYAIAGNGVRVTYDADRQTVTLYRTEGFGPIQMSKPSPLGGPVVGGQEVQGFSHISCDVEQSTSEMMGDGRGMTITSQSMGTSLIRTHVLETSDIEEGVVYTATSYEAGTSDVETSWFIGNVYELYGAGGRIWSYNGGGEGPMHYYGTLQKIDLTDFGKFSRENKQDDTAASIPVSDTYIADRGITVGDAFVTRREVHTPVQETSDSTQVSIGWPGEVITAGSAIEISESSAVVHPGDYYSDLRGYKNTMDHLDVIVSTPGDIPNSSYDLRWESWDWGFNWTIDLVIDRLDEPQAVGIGQITLDGGWYTNAGDWALNPEKFPNGTPGALRLTDAIHEHGMTALLWWRPYDGGIGSTFYQQHPEYFVMDADGGPVELPAPGGETNPSLGYVLCPMTDGAIASQVDFVNRAMNDWGLDGFKGDYVWGMPECYNPAHNHASPKGSTERQSETYRVSYEAMMANDPNVLNLLYDCGTPQDYYSLPYMTQIATADPTSVDQTRRRVKAYKALAGDYFPVTAGHNSIWYPDAVGTGSVLIERRGLSDTTEKECKKWLGITGIVQLQKGRFIGDLYSYGFDPYETYMVEKNGVIYYTFYKDGGKYSPTSCPDTKLKGLDPDKMYRIVNYVNDRVVATNLMGDNAVFNTRSSGYLLVRAVEVSEPDPGPVDPDYGFISVDDRNEALIYTGTWHDGNNTSFGEETVRYTNSTGVSVVFFFTGTSIRWYDQRDINFGTVEIYLDDKLRTIVDANGAAEAGVCLFEALDLPAAEHTIKIVCRGGVIDIDRSAYEAATLEPIYKKIDVLSDRITYVGNQKEYHNSGFYAGSAMHTDEVSAYAGLVFRDTVVRLYAGVSFNFGTAGVYLDGELVENIILYGQEVAGQLMFERTGLEEGEHTIRLVQNAWDINLNYIPYLPEQNQPTPPGTAVTIDAMDTQLVYTGVWNDDYHGVFQEGAARYAISAGASVGFKFTESETHWYEQNDSNFGVASVYINNEFVQQININRATAMGELSFQKTGLPAGPHTIRVVRDTPVIDLDYLTYTIKA